MAFANATQFQHVDHLFVFKSMFYLLSPADTYYKHMEDVPDISTKVCPSYNLEIIYFY